MRDLNKFMAIGHLGSDPEMRFTPKGSAVTTFRVATNRSWKTDDGVRRDETEWFRVVAWGDLAEICNEYLRKGSRVYVEGRLQTRSWSDLTTGEKRFMTEVVAQDVIILTPRGSDRSASPDGSPRDPSMERVPPPNTDGEDDLPF
jgi:single-strand DNA-binding protein